MNRYRSTTFLTCAIVALIAGDAAAFQVQISKNFTATRLTEAVPGIPDDGVTVPDTNGAIGPNHYVELINQRFTIFDTGGTEVVHMDDDVFWLTALAKSGADILAATPFDPRILYYKGHWYAAASSGPKSAGNRLFVGVTTGDDPSIDNWYGFEMRSDLDGDRWADFPKMGINDDGVYISSRMIPVPNSGVSGQLTSVWGIPQSSLTAATPSIAGAVYHEDISNGTIGVDAYPAVNNTDIQSLHLPSFMLSADGSTEDPGRLRLSQIPTNFFTTGQVNTSAEDVGGLPTVSNPFLARQPDSTKQGLDPGRSNFSGSVIQVGSSLWAVQAVVSDDNRDGARWVQLNPYREEGNQLIDFGVISDPNLDFIVPSIAVNDFGHVVIGFTGSGNAQSASSYVSVGQHVLLLHHGIPIGQQTDMSAPILVKQGTGSYERVADNRNRWGDYSATTIDPDNPLSFWTHQEFLAAEDDWATQVTKLSFVSDNSRVAPGTYRVRREVIYDTGFHASLDEQAYGGSQDGTLGAFQLRDYDQILFIGAPELRNVNDRQTVTANASLFGTISFGLDTYDLLGVDAQLAFTAVVTNVEDEFTTIDTELQTFYVDLIGAGLPFDAWIDLDPELTYGGQIMIHEFEPGSFYIPGFFDLRTRLNIELTGDQFPEEISTALNITRLQTFALLPEPSAVLTVAVLLPLLVGRRRGQ